MVLRFDGCLFEGGRWEEADLSQSVCPSRGNRKGVSDVDRMGGAAVIARGLLLNKRLMRAPRRGRRLLKNGASILEELLRGLLTAPLPIKEGSDAAVSEYQQDS